ncbi:MAG TPA: hypothetical protein VKA97_09040, partial [Pyrinomonadaceae bacterium]|nr:hypothetical protein [Pyrinomonadaceae bacterium]
DLSALLITCSGRYLVKTPAEPLAIRIAPELRSHTSRVTPPKGVAVLPATTSFLNRNEFAYQRGQQPR